MVLTERQRDELNRAILDYLVSSGLGASAAAVAGETGIALDSLDKKNEGMLEKKWTSVVRLQKKVMDLEAKLGDATQEIRAPKLGGVKDNTTWLPRPPPR